MTMLKLAALDAEDLEVLSSQVQDAVVRVGAIRWMPSEGRAVISMNRFAWEEAIERKRGFFAPQQVYERHQSVLHFDRVRALRARNIRMNAENAVLNLLAITFKPNGDGPDGQVSMIFAGDAELRLDVECIEAQLADTGAAWETENLPEHEAAETFEQPVTSQA